MATDALILKGVGETLAGLGLVSARLPDLSAPLREAGIYMATSSVPRNFQMGGRPNRWPGSTRWNAPAGDPLFDQGYLVRSIDYAADASSLTLGSPLLKSALLQYGTAEMPGGVLRPKSARFLAIPQFGPGKLSKQQIRAGVRPRSFADAFVLMKGPEGPGLYRKSATVPNDPFAYARKNRGSRATGVKLPKAPGMQKTVTRIFAFLTEVHIPARPFLLFQDEDADVISEFLLRYLFADGGMQFGSVLAQRLLAAAA